MILDFGTAFDRFGYLGLATTKFNCSYWINLLTSIQTVIKGENMHFIALMLLHLVEVMLLLSSLWGFCNDIFFSSKQLPQTNIPTYLLLWKIRD